MRNVLLALLFTISLSNCKKEDQETALNLVDSRWELSWYPAGSDVIWFDRLDFTSSTEVVYYKSFTTNKLMSAQGKASLTYTIEGADTESPKIHIKGTLNSAAGGVGKGEVVDYKLTYVPSTGGENPKLSIDNTRAYTKIVFY